MNRIFSITTTLILCTLLAGAQETTEVKSFRNIPWGTHVDSVVINGDKVNFIQDESGVERNSYVISNDDMDIGTAKLNKINYIFNDEKRFIKVFMIGDKEFQPDMEFIVNYKFGEPTNIRKLGYVTLKDWKVGDVIFTLSEFANRDLFTLTIESRWEYSEKFKKNMNVSDF